MTEELDHYLTDCYRRDILGESVGVEMPAPDPKLIASAKAEIARIDALRLGASLVNRDFVAYQNRRALIKLLQQLEAQVNQEAPLAKLEG
jgi:hypothetical protein